MKTYSPGAITIAMEVTGTSKVAQEAINEYNRTRTREEREEEARRKFNEAGLEAIRKDPVLRERARQYDLQMRQQAATPSATKKYTGPELPKFYKIPGQINDTVMKWAEAFAKTPTGAKVKGTLHIVFPKKENK